LNTQNASAINSAGPDTEISQRINILRYFMIFGIIMLHTPQFVPLVETGSAPFDFLKATFQHAIFRCSVPVLTCISGYLLFKASYDLKYPTLVVKKVRTLLVPLIIFNLPLAGLVYMTQVMGVQVHDFSQTLHPFQLRSWADAVIGLFESPVNYPLNFLRDLFVISLLSPIAGFALRNFMWPGFAIVFAVFWFGWDGKLILINDMAFMFYIGGMAAVGNWNLRALDKYAPVLLLGFLALCVAIVALQIESKSYIRLVAPFMIWPAASLLVNTFVGTRIAALAKYSFLTFLVHGPILLVSWMAYQKVFAATVPYWVYWVVTPVIIAVLTIGIHSGVLLRCPCEEYL